MCTTYIRPWHAARPTYSVSVYGTENSRAALRTFPRIGKGGEKNGVECLTFQEGFQILYDNMDLIKDNNISWKEGAVPGGGELFSLLTRLWIGVCSQGRIRTLACPRQKFHTLPRKKIKINKITSLARISVSNQDQNTPLARLLGLKTTPFPGRHRVREKCTFARLLG